LNRQLAQAQTQERAARTAAKKAEASAKALREETVRLKQTVTQIRASAANDIRKRDLTLAKLKTHLSTQQRGAKSAQSAMTLVIQPGVGKVSSVPGRSEESVPVDAHYDLTKETTEFLTKLSQSLSDENDALITLVRSSLATLKKLQGFPGEQERASELEVIEEDPATSLVSAPPIAVDVLEKEMDHVLESLRTILTSPNFVPIDEVHVRDEEIHKLRAGWDKMEAKWRDTVVMMDSWQKRVLNGDDAMNIEEIKRVLGLGKQVNMETGLLDDDTMSIIDASVDDIQGSFQVSADLDLSREALTAPSRPATKPRSENALKEASGNTHRSPKRVAFPLEPRHEVIVDENTCGSEGTSTNQSSLGKASFSRKRDGGSKVSCHDDEPGLFMVIDPNMGRKRSSSPTPLAGERSPKLTLQEKLNIAQAEAEAEMVASGLKLEDLAPGGVAVTKGAKVRRAGVTGRPRRRKSTLTPDELEKLMYAD